MSGRRHTPFLDSTLKKIKSAKRAAEEKAVQGRTRKNIKGKRTVRSEKGGSGWVHRKLLRTKKGKGKSGEANWREGEKSLHEVRESEEAADGELRSGGQPNTTM